jgi:putative intracellular protease/amidase
MTDDTKVDELKLAPLPLQFGLIVYPQFEVLDVFGPLEALNVVGRKEFGPKNVDISLVIIAETLEPVSSMAKCSKIDQRILPTHTFETAAKLELDVLLVPGGLGSDAPNKAAIKFIADRFGSLQYLITVCTGADLAARAGVLDGLCATTNKAAWV